MPTSITLGKRASTIAMSDSTSSHDELPTYPSSAKNIQVHDEKVLDASSSGSDSHPSLAPLLGDVYTLRHKLVGRRVEVQNERHFFAEQRKHALRAHQAFADLCNAFDDGSFQQPDLKALRDGLKKVQESHRTLDQIDRDLQQHESRLTTQEDALRKKEAKLYDHMAKYRHLAGRTFSASGDTPSLKITHDFSSHSGSTTDSSAMEAPIVQEYYDKIGDVGILRERLFNFEAEHQRQLKLREARRHEQRSITVPEDKFIQEYFEGRRDLVQEYMTASVAVQTLKVKCREQGHDVEAPNIVPLDGRDALDRTARIGSLFPHRENLLRTSDILPYGNMERSIYSHPADSKLRVLQWLDSIYSHRTASDPVEELSFAKTITFNPEDADDVLPPDTVLQNSRPIGLWQSMHASSPREKSSRSSVGALSRFHGDAPVRRYSDASVQVRGEAVRATASSTLQSPGSAT